MQNLQVFFINHFDTDRLADDAIRKFAEDHLQRLAKTGAYPALSSAIQTVYTGYFGAITDEATKTAVREGQTRAVENAVKAIKDAVSQQEGTIRGKFGENSSQYQEFLPQGVTEYRKATLENIEEKLVRFANAADKYKADVPGLNSQFDQLHTDFTAARNAQLGTKGDVSTGKTMSRTKRDVVEKQLMTNVLTIALDFIGDPQGGLAFFDQEILNPPSSGAKTPAKPSTP